MVSLFTKIPVPEALSIITNLVDEETLNLISISLSSTFFSYNGIIYEQTEGITMGSSLSPVVTNICMEHFEAKALNSWHLKPKCWFRFVDDTFVIWQHGHQALHAFLDHLNSITPLIQYTMEIESNRSLPFLDVLVSCLSDDTLSHHVYRKKTHMDHYLHACSYDHPSQKFGVLKTLVSRALKILAP